MTKGETMATTVTQMVSEARSRILNLYPHELENHLMQRVSLLVDIREGEELREQGLIPSAFHAPRGLLEFWADPLSPSHRPELDPDRRIVLYCAAGSRSALAAECLQRLGFTDIAHLEGGIAAWKQAGYPVIALDD
jgi:rhodanese-related sulfurtransferase